MPRPLLILDPVHGGAATGHYDIENGVPVTLPADVLADPGQRRYLDDDEHAAWKGGQRDEEPRYVIHYRGRQVTTGEPGGRCVLDPQLREKDIVLDVARTISRELEPACVVKMTRERDGFVGLQQRRKYVDRLVNRFGHPAILLSLQAATCDEPAKCGFIVRHRPGNDEDLAACLHWELSSHLEELGLSGPPAVGGIREQSTPLLDLTDLPAASVQLGFPSNSEDARRLMSRPLREELALRLADGLRCHLDRRAEETVRASRSRAAARPDGPAVVAAG